MDIANPQLKIRKRRRMWLLLAGTALALVAVALAVARLGPALPKVDRSSVWIDTVKRGDMLREVRAPGTLVPRDIHWLAAENTARVAKIEVWQGTRVDADTVLMRLASSQVDSDLRNAQAQVAAAAAQVAAKRAELQSQLLDERSSLAQAESDYASTKVKADADAKAVAKQLIPRVQYDQEQIALKQLQHRVQVEQQRVQAFGAGITAQMDAVQAELQLQRSNLTLRQRQADALNVRAGIAGVLQEVAVQEGQQVAAGTNLARVARPDVLIARLRVPEVQAKDVTLGMSAQVNTYNGMIDGKVTRIDPAVVDGSVRVDVTPTGKLPAGARPDLSVDGRIRIARLDKVLSVGRPALAKADGDISLFRLDPDGDTATRVAVRVGAASVDRVQILHGLKAGDQVILSDTSQWDAYDRIRLDWIMPESTIRLSFNDGALMNETANVIALSSIRKVFQADEVETHALSDVHLSIARGEYVSISGPSGCGKTTLLSILGLLDTASAGSYVLNGHDVAALNAAARARIRNAEIGFIFQAFNLIGDLSVEENVELPLTYRSGIASGERRARVQEALERVGMAHRMRHYPAQLSGGQQQRVAVARALVGKPAILLADEPTGNLDSRNGEAVMALLDELHKAGATICMVTHDARYAELADRKIRLFDGCVVDEETFDRLRHEDEQRLDALIGQRVEAGA